MPGGSWMRWNEPKPFSNWGEASIPVESYGMCKRAKRCGNWNVLLGDGVCVNCWDREWSHIKAGNYNTKENGDNDGDALQSTPKD
jgi:hypothetical protein